MSLLSGMGPQGAALALLVLGHVLGDFALQTTWMVENKHRATPLFAHGIVVTVTHLVALTPMLTARTAVILAGVGILHVLVDGVKARMRSPGEERLGLFAGDQVAHLIVLVVAWRLLDPSAWTASPLVLAVDGIPYQGWTMLTTGAVYLAAFVFVHHGGNAIVRGVLPRPRPEDPAEDELEAGRRIGTIERLLVMVLALGGQWSAIALVVAAKSIARFEELKERPFAEYFLVGTLASVLVAVALALAVQALV